MKPILCLIPLLCLQLPAAATDVEVKLQQLKDIGLLPEEKLAYRPEEKLDPKRSNPFAERAKSKQSQAVETVETEEIKIRRVFDTLKVSGLTKYNGKYTALMGDLIIEEGSQIAPVIANQTQILRATRVNDKYLEIVWVEGAGYETKAPRRIVKRVEMAPRVGVLLAAQPVGTTETSAMTYLDEHGKVIWQKKITPNLGGMMDNLSNTGTATLSEDEESALMVPPQGGTDFSQEPAADEAAPLDSAAGAVPVDPATALEDPVEPASEADSESAPPESDGPG